MKIDRMLHQENEAKKREIQVLLVGSPNSGKNTLSKQIRIHYGDGFPPGARVELIPMILANLTDAVVLVLKNLMHLRIEFADTATKTLASELMQTQPEDGFISEVSHVKRISQLQTPNHEYKLNDTSNTFTTETADILFNNPSIQDDMNRTETGISFLVQRDSVEMVSDTLPDANIPKPLDDDQLCLQESLLRILQRNESVPPSLMKKFELLADSNIVEELREALVDITKLRKLYLKLFGQNQERLSSSLHRDGPPPVPASPPPMSFEDELLDCMVFSNGELSSDSESQESSNQTSDTEYDFSTFPRDKLSRNMVNRKISNITEHSCSNKQTDRKKQVKMTEDELPYNLPKLSTDRCRLETQSIGGYSAPVLKVILKLITEQPEFQEAMQRRTFITPPVGYADFYFIEHVDRIIQEDYLPTLQDILVMREPSKAVRETLISIGSTTLRTVDLGQQVLCLHKHLHYFESISTVLFVVSLADCFKRAYISNKKNEIETSVELFETLLFSPHMSKKDFVIFLNKLDAIREQFSNDNLSDGREQDEVTVFVESVKERFLAIKRRQDVKGSHISIHVICALDVDEMKEVMRECLRTIFEYNRKRHVLL